MKYFLYAVLFSLPIILVGCVSNPPSNDKDTTQGTTTGDLSSSGSTMNGTQLPKPTQNTTAENGHTVKVDYIGTLPDGKMFDTSIEAEAKKGGLHQEGRAYSPLSFTLGTKMMIPGFEKAVLGMKKGETKTVTLKPEEAYGEYDVKRTTIVPKEQLPLQEGQVINKGDMLMNIAGQKFKVTNVDDKGNVTIDMNHELAGKTLIFKITLKEIQ